MPEAADIVTLLVDGEELSGFKTVSIISSLETLCGSFDVTLADKLDGKNFKLKTQSSCVVKIGNDTVITGYIDRVNMKVDPRSHTVSIRGRDKTADLVDSSIVTPPLEYAKKQDLFKLVQKWVAPHGLTVVKDYDIVPQFPQKIAVSIGETVAEVIIRACRMKGIIPITDGLGRLLLTASGGELSDDSLAWEVNVKSGEAQYDYANRFYKYTFRTQNNNEDEVIAELWNRSLEVSGSATDPSVKRTNRQVVLDVEHDATRDECKKRAEVEALVRAANGQGASVVVQGWRQSTGKLWKKNMIVPVDIPPLYINQELLISEVNYMLGDDGSETLLKLVRPDAFNPGTKFKIPRRSGISSATPNGSIKKQAETGFGF
jgi:prophage tail gpP-like protein